MGDLPGNMDFVIDDIELIEVDEDLWNMDLELDDGRSPAHPDIPKKPHFTTKSSASKSPLVPPTKNAPTSSKSPVPKPKPRVVQRTPNECPSLSLPYTNNHLQPSDGNNGLVGDIEDSSPRDVIISSNTNISEDNEKCTRGVAEEMPRSEQLGSCPTDQNIQPCTPERDRKQPLPKPSPKTPNPKPPPRRAKSCLEPTLQKTTSVKTEVCKSNENLSVKDEMQNKEITDQHSHTADKTPTVSKKKLSRDISQQINESTSSNLLNGEEAIQNKVESIAVPGKSATNSPTRPPLLPIKRKALKEGESSTSSNLLNSEKAIRDKIYTNAVPVKSAPNSPARPQLPFKRKPLKEFSTAAVDEESPPTSPRRRHANGNPAMTNRIRAKSEYMKKKPPTRPPLPAVKTISQALPVNTTPPPPLQPKPSTRKSQYIPNTEQLPFPNLDTGDKSYHESSVSPKIPPRTKRSRSLENIVNAKPESCESIGLEKDLQDSLLQTCSMSDTATSIQPTSLQKSNQMPQVPPIIPRTSETSAENAVSLEETTHGPPVTPKKPVPLQSHKSKDSPSKLKRSSTGPESGDVPKVCANSPVERTRKAPPVPLKPINTSQFDNENVLVEASSNGPTSPSFSTTSPCQSPKLFQNSPKRRPRGPPPPPPPLGRTASPVVPETSRRITSKTRSLDATLTEYNNDDPICNISRTLNDVENENAKNSKCIAQQEANHSCNIDSQGSSSHSAVQSMLDMSRSSTISEDDDYVLPDPDLQSSPRKILRPEDQTYNNKQIASIRPSRRKGPPRPVKPVLSRVSIQSPPTSPTTCPVMPNNFKNELLQKRVPPSKPVRRSMSINSDISNDGYEDMSKGSDLASSLGIGSRHRDVYSVPRSCEHASHESGQCICAQQYANQSSGDEDEGSPSDDEDSYEKFDEDASSQKTHTIGNATKAALVAREIRDSEKTFVDVLKLLNEDFRQAIDDAGIKEGRPVIEQLLLQPILGHLPQLQDLNEGLLQDLDNQVEHWDENPSISSIFLKKGPYLKLYSSYIRDFEKITTVFDEACGRFPLFGAAVRDFELSERCQNLAVKHYMLKPIQRIPQYKMLLTDYLKQLEAGTTEHAETAAALNIVSEVANHANECMRQGDNFGKLLQIQHSLIGNHEIVKPGRVFIKEGEVLKLSRKEMQPRKFFLMSDILLYTTPFTPGQYKLKNVLSLAGTRVSKPQLEDFKNEFNIISVQRSFTLSASTPEERDGWIQALVSAIADYATKRSSLSVFQPQMMEGDTSSLGRKAPIWIPDSRVTMCMICTCEFTITWRRHHCRACGNVVCGNCSMNKVPLMYLSQKVARVCEECFAVLAKAECEDTDGKERARYKSKRKKSLKETKRPSALKEVTASESDTNMSGYLHSKRKKDWKRMWFVLKGKVLYTYKASEDVAALESKPLLGYEIKVVSEYYEGIEPGLVLQLYHQGRVMSVFRTESKTAADKWAFAMIDATTL